MLVEDVNRTVAFYRDELGFQLVMAAPQTDGPDWALMRRGRVELLFQARHSLARVLPDLRRVSGGGALTLYFDVSDAVGLYGRLQARVEVVQPLQHTDYGTREFSIRDPNGFILTFAEHHLAQRAAA